MVTDESVDLGFVVEALTTFEVVVVVGLDEALSDVGEQERHAWATREALSLAMSFAASDLSVSVLECRAIIQSFMGRDPALGSGEVGEAVDAVFANAEDFDTWKYTPSPVLRMFAAADRMKGTHLVADYRAAAVLVAKSVCALDELGDYEFADLNRFAYMLGFVKHIVDRGSAEDLEMLEDYYVTDDLVTAYHSETGVFPIIDDEVDRLGSVLLRSGMDLEDDMAEIEPSLLALQNVPLADSGGGLDGKTIRTEETLEAVLEELDALVGLPTVKADVRSLANRLHIDTLRRSQGMRVPDSSRHLVFVGNPGTGKTSVARLLARIYRVLGARRI